MQDDTSALAGCPFCGAAMTDDQFGFDHPKGTGADDDCILSFASFTLSLRPAWNTRAALNTRPAPSGEEVERVARAMAEARPAFPISSDLMWREYVPYAQAAIAALRAGDGR